MRKIYRKEEKLIKKQRQERMYAIKKTTQKTSEKGKQKARREKKRTDKK